MQWNAVSVRLAFGNQYSIPAFLDRLTTAQVCPQSKSFAKVLRDPFFYIQFSFSAACSALSSLKSYNDDVV